MKKSIFLIGILVFSLMFSVTVYAAQDFMTLAEWKAADTDDGNMIGKGTDQEIWFSGTKEGDYYVKDGGDSTFGDFVLRDVKEGIYIVSVIAEIIPVDDAEGNVFNISFEGNNPEINNQGGYIEDSTRRDFTEDEIQSGFYEYKATFTVEEEGTFKLCAWGSTILKQSKVKAFRLVNEDAKQDTDTTPKTETKGDTTPKTDGEDSPKTSDAGMIVALLAGFTSAAAGITLKKRNRTSS